jgi:hypothetical protein
VDLVLVVVGVRPNTSLAQTAGVKLGVRGAVATSSASTARTRGCAMEALHLDIPSVAVDGIVGWVTWQALVSGMLSF